MNSWDVLDVITGDLGVALLGFVLIIVFIMIARSVVDRIG
jgi:hypothetical protein